MNKTTSCAALAVIAALCGCGGEGDGADPSSEPVPAASSSNTATPADFAGTAYLKTETIDKLNGEPVAHTGMLDTCNAVRQRYYSAAAVMPGQDVIVQTYPVIVEQYLDRDKAAKYETQFTLELSDYSRWQAAVLSQGRMPDAPPDCSVAAVRSFTVGQIWRDGVRYDLDFEHQEAVGVPSSAVWTPWPRETAQQTEAHPADRVLSEKCYVYSQTTVVGTSESCLWDRFPNASYLSWPWLLRSHLTESDASRQHFTEAVELSRDQPVDAAKFEIPAGFKVKVLPS